MQHSKKYMDKYIISYYRSFSSDFTYTCDAIEDAIWEDWYDEPNHLTYREWLIKNIIAGGETK